MTAQPMDPKDVPGKILAAALADWTGYDDPLNDCAAVDIETAATILAAAIHAIRAQVADEIAYERDKQIHQDPDLDPEDKLARWIDDVYQRCIRTARGDQ